MSYIKKCIVIVFLVFVGCSKEKQPNTDISRHEQKKNQSCHIQQWFLSIDTTTAEIQPINEWRSSPFFNDDLNKITTYSSVHDATIKATLFFYRKNGLQVTWNNLMKLPENPSLLLKGCFVIFRCEDFVIKFDKVDCKNYKELANLVNILRQFDTDEYIICDYGGPCKISVALANPR